MEYPVTLFDGYNLGTDPEMFAIDRDNNCVPPFILRKEYGLKVIGGKPDEKGFVAHPEFFYGPLITFKAMQIPSYVIMEDGAAIEIPISPSNNSKDIYTRLALAKIEAHDILKQYGFSLYTKPVINFNSEAFSQWKDTEDFKFAVRFGCDKDFDIYGGKFSQEIDASKVFQRFAGGHVHLSSIVRDLHRIYKPLTKLMDIAVGNYFIAHTPFPREEAMRQQYYGKPGRIRFPTYPNGEKGIEYRTPSISLWDSYESICNLFRAINWIIDTLDNVKKTLDTIEGYLDTSLENIITFNQTNAKSVLDELKVLR